MSQDGSPSPEAEARAGWLERRRQGIGSSDAAAVLGLSPHRTAMHVYLDKLGELPDRESEAMRWGRLLEPVVAAGYAEATGHEVRLPPEPTLAHPEHPFLLASLDRLAVVDGEVRVLEIKTTQRADHWGEPGTDDVPDDVMAQVQHQLLVSGHDRAEVAVLAGVSDFRIYKVRASRRWQEAALPAYIAFWARVTLGEPPELDWRHPSSYDLVRLLYGDVHETTVELGADAEALAVELQSVKAAERGYREDAKRLRARLLERMGAAGVARLPGGGSLARKKIFRPGYQVADTEYVTLTVKL